MDAASGGCAVGCSWLRWKRGSRPGAPGLANPKTRLGIALFNTGLKVASTLLPLFSRFGSPPSEKLELPDYE